MWLNVLTGQAFISREEFFGPSSNGVGNFTTAERLDTGNCLFDYDGFGQVNRSGDASLFGGAPGPYPANDITMVSDNG